MPVKKGQGRSRHRADELPIAELKNIVPVTQKVEGQRKTGTQEIFKSPAPDRLARIIQYFLCFRSQPEHQRESPDLEPVLYVYTDALCPVISVAWAALVHLEWNSGRYPINPPSIVKTVPLPGIEIQPGRLEFTFVAIVEVKESSPDFMIPPASKIKVLSDFEVEVRPPFQIDLAPGTVVRRLDDVQPAITGRPIIVVERFRG